MSNSRIGWMDQLRGIAVLLVIAFHAQTIMGRFVPSIPAEVLAFVEFFAPFRMPTLMFLSGMLLARSLKKPPAEYFTGKLRGIAWPYVLWSLIFLAATGQLSAHNLLAIALVPPTYLWYLWFLLAFYVLAWILTKFAVPAWVGLAIALVGSTGPDTFRISRFFFLLIFFLLGHLYVTHGRLLGLDARRSWMLPLSSFVFLVSGAASVAGIDVQYNTLFIFSPICAVITLVLVFPALRSGTTLRALAFVGRDSIVFYVSHFTAIWLVVLLLQTIGVDNFWALYAVAVLTSLALGVLFTWARHRNCIVDSLFQFPTVSFSSIWPAKGIQSDSR